MRSIIERYIEHLTNIEELKETIIIADRTL